MAQVTMPDGSLVELPDNPTPEQKAAVQAKLAQMQQPAKPRGAVDQTLSFVKSVWDDAARGLGKTVVGIPETLLNARRATLAAVRGEEPEFDWAWTNRVEKDIPTPQGDPAWRKVMRTGAEAVGGNLIMPGGGTAAGAASAFGGGAGAEVASNLLGDNYASRLLGGLVGAFGANWGAGKVAAMRPQSQALAREALEGISDQQLSAAQKFQADAAKRGVTLDLAQALEGIGVPASNLTTIRNVLANKKQGENVQQTLRNQPGELELLAKSQVDQLPGTNYGEAQAANNLAETATARVNQVKADRSAAVRPLYQQAGNLSPAVRKAVADEISNALTQPGVTEAAATSMKQALSKLKASPGTGAPTTHALDYDTLIGDLIGPYKGTPMSPADPKTLGQLQALGGKLNGILKQSSPELVQAEARYAQLSRDVVDPLKQGPVGQLATPRGYKPDTQASIAKMQQLFANGVDPQSTNSPILTAAKELSKVDKAAFADAAKAYYSSKVAQAFEPTAGNTVATNADAAERLYSTLFKDQKQWQGMRDTAAGIADTYGLSRADVVRGLENFMQIVKAARSRPQTTGGLSFDDTVQMAGKSQLANSARVFGFLPFERLARGIEDAAMGKTFSEFDRLLTSPEGAATLAKLGRVPVISPQARALIAGFSGSQAGQSEAGGQETRTDY